jgi:RNA polymerase sigma factor (sigma-70 family)
MVAIRLDRAPLGAEETRGPNGAELLERFVSRKDAAALAALVERFGAMVWGICRRLLSTEQDAEDAFQAVFLVLMKQGRTIRNREAVGSWLYGVAYRTALQARRDLAHRKKAETRASAPAAPPTPTAEVACRELQAMLDEEVQRLPAKLQAPFVLCCLENMSKAEAAAELRWKEGTVSSRLAQARKLLKQRLTRRGITLSAVLTLLALTRESAATAVPPLLLQTTVSGLAGPVAGQMVSLSPAAVSLAEGISHTLAVAKGKLLATALLTMTLALGGTTVALNQPQQAPRANPAGFYQDFRGSQEPVLPLTLFGVKAAQVTQPEARGLHIHVQANDEQRTHIGVMLPLRFRGDFEITAAYEIVRGDIPEFGHGVGVGVLTTLDAPVRELLELMRLARPREGNVYGCTRILGPAGNEKFQHHWMPTGSKAGHLRMTRRGSEVTYSAREGGAESFTELFRRPCATADIKEIRLAAYMGFAPNANDVYLKDLRVGPPGAGSPAAPDPNEPKAEPASSPRQDRTFLLLFVILLLSLLAALGLAALYAIRRKRRESKTAKNAAPCKPSPGAG